MHGALDVGTLGVTSLGQRRRSNFVRIEGCTFDDDIAMILPVGSDL